MKNILVLVPILILVISLSSCETMVSVPVTASWKQVINDQSTFGGWEIYVASSENGTYSLLSKVPFTEIKDTYSSINKVSVKKNDTTIKWFKALAYSKDGLKSDYSNKVSLLIIP